MRDLLADLREALAQYRELCEEVVRLFERHGRGESMRAACDARLRTIDALVGRIDTAQRTV